MGGKPTIEDVRGALSELMAEGSVTSMTMESAKTGKLETLYYFVGGPEYRDMGNANVLCNACGRVAAEANGAGVCRGCGSK